MSQINLILFYSMIHLPRLKEKRKKYQPIIKDEYDSFINALKTLNYNKNDLVCINLPELKRKFELLDLINQKIKKREDWQRIIPILSILFTKLPEETINFYIDSIYKNNKKNYKFIFELVKEIDFIPKGLFNMILIYDQSFLEVYFEKVDWFTYKNTPSDCLKNNINFIFNGLIKNKKIDLLELVDWLIYKDDNSKILAFKLLTHLYTKEKNEINSDFKFYKEIKENLLTKNDLLLQEILLLLSNFKINSELNELIVEILFIRCKPDIITKLIADIIDISLLNTFNLENLYKIVSLNISLFLKLLPQIPLTDEMIDDLIILLSNSYDRKRDYIYKLLLPVIKISHSDTIFKALERDNLNSKLLLLSLLNKIIQSVNEMTFLNLCVVLENESDKKIIYEILLLLKNKKNDWLIKKTYLKIVRFTKVYLLVYPMIEISDEYKVRFSKFNNEDVKRIVREFYQIGF